MTRKLAILFFALSTLGVILPLFAEDTRQAVDSKTERVDFAPGGLIRCDGSFGSLNIEGWDRSEVEIAVTKTTEKYYRARELQEAAKLLEGVHISTERRSDTELTISTSKGKGVLLDYEIRVPRDSRLVIRHGVGQVLVSNVTGDIEAAGHRGDILLMLPNTGMYSIDAQTKLGVVTSDVAGEIRRRRYLAGERLASPAASHRLNLRMGFGGITIKGVPPEAVPPLAASAR
jgi:hypothetical protein